MAKEKNKATVKESSALSFLYNNVFGRIILKLLTARWISKLAGRFLDSRMSKRLIKKFVKNNNIDLNDYESDNFKCFNDCFCRKIKDGLRPIELDPNALIAPCDGLLSVYRIEEGTVLPVKQSSYTVRDLLADDALAERYRGGLCLVFRLCVDHYHRYCYPVDGEKGENRFLRGRLHTVRPIALAKYPVFVQNCREYTVTESDTFGSVLQMEVGAMLVGRIKNHHGAQRVARGEEKGMFLYGGSTVILMLERDRAELAPELFAHTADGLETPVRMGEQIGMKK